MINRDGAVGAVLPSLAEEVEFQYDELGRQKKIIEPRGTTEFTYDDRGKLIQQSTPEGTLNYAYDAKTGARTRVWTANSDIRYTYDVMNRPKTVVVHKRNGIDLSSPEVTTYDYTKVGSRASIELPNGITTAYQYDNLNRLKTLTHKKAGELVASYAYDLLPTGRRSGVTEVTSNGTSWVNYTYDNLYRLTHEVRTGEQPYDIQYAYDLNGNRIQKIDGLDTINYTYNANDQLITETSGANGTTAYEYDVNGSLTSKRNTGKFSYTYEYDLRNRLSCATITRKEGLHDVTIEAQYTYNTGGIRTQALQTINGITQNRYFLLDSGHTGYNQVFEESDNLGGSPVRSYVIGDDILSQTVGAVANYLLYDGHGSTRMLANSEGAISGNYSYDAYGKMFGGDPNVTDKLSQTDLLYAGEQFDPGLQMQYLRARYYDANTGRFNRDLSSPEVTTYDYTKVGSRASVELPNGITTSYQYDNLNRLKNLTHKKAGELVASYAYDLLPTGRRSGVTEVTSNGTSRVNYTYDNLYRLTHEVRTGEQPYDIQYAYDLNGNRVQKIDGSDTINYAYNANDQLTNETSSVNGTTVYVYDVNGSLTTKENSGKFSYQYGYDLRNRLASATITRKEGLQDVSIEAQYAYNVNGIRTQSKQTINNISQDRYFLLDSGLSGHAQIFEEFSSLGSNPVRSYAIGDDVLNQTVGGATSYLLYDGHGNSRMLSNPTGIIIENYNYDAYGKMLGGDPNVTDKQSKTDLLYAGEQFDSGLQMQYQRARYYDTNIGRFNRLDPFFGNLEDPQSFHKYIYAHNDPGNRIDPSGYAVYFVKRKFASPGLSSQFLYRAMDMGHGYLLITADNDDGKADPFTSTYALKYSFSWHPDHWDYAERSNTANVNDSFSRTRGRIWMNHTDDIRPKRRTYTTYLITTDPTKQRQLLSTILTWGKSSNVGWEKGEPREDSSNPNNQIGRNHIDSQKTSVYYSLLEQNCVWWATIMICQAGIALPQAASNAIIEFNDGGGAAKDVIRGNRQATEANRLLTVPRNSFRGGYYFDTLP